MPRLHYYTFYESKEYLYLDIVQAVQRSIFAELDAILEANAALPGKERVRQVFGEMFTIMQRYPILAKMDEATVELIARKVSKERLAGFIGQNLDAAQSLHNHGVRFACDVRTASYVFQALYQSWIFLQDKGGEVQASVTEILLDGLIDRIVVE